VAARRGDSGDREARAAAEPPARATPSRGRDWLWRPANDGPRRAAARPAAGETGDSGEVELWPEDSFGPLVGASPPMRELFARLGRIAATDATVLVQGESGTGKELVGRALHQASGRAAGPFVVVDCAGLPPGLLEAELFGTGGDEPRAGAFESAAGGTVLLDEIGELPPGMQPKLLRVLESRTVRRLGECPQRPIDVRFVSTTGRDLPEMVKGGRFREDLYFRLAVLPVRVPPLRERPEDIPLLLARFLARGPEAPALDPDLIADLRERPWLGNVRELRNFAERLVTFGPVEALALGDAGASLAAAPPGEAPLPYREAREQALDAFERGYLRELLARHGGSVAAAAHSAGINRAYLYRLIQRHGV
jgi:DNA-binding NtrC family response regulator